MSLLRRNVGEVADASRARSGSTIWEDEAKEYWQRMEPVKQYRRRTRSLGRLGVVVLLCGGVLIGARVALDHERVLAFKATVIDSFLAVTLLKFHTADKAATAVSETGAETFPTIEAGPSAPIIVDHELLRSRCRVRGVQSTWHQETCRKLCMRDPYHAACMNGCSYGSLTMTKLVCDKMEAAEAAVASRCPDGVSCMEACRAYDDETPFPDLRNSCVRGCSNIVPSACARSLQIYGELTKPASP